MPAFDRGARWIRGAAVAVLCAAPGGGQSAADPRLAAVDAPPYLLGPSDPTELSGLTWLGGDRFVAVSDGRAGIYPYTIDVDRVDGRIRSVSAGVPITLTGPAGEPIRGQDLEGIAYDPSTGGILVVDEAPSVGGRPRIRRHRLRDGLQTGSIDLPAALGRRFRTGVGLESLALADGTVWTASEEALDGDGPRSTTEAGTLVRLLRFDDGAPAGQWVYRTAPHGGELPYDAVALSGVVDVAVLPDGRLLVLERATVGRRSLIDVGGFMSRVVLADPAGATDVSAIDRLAGLRPGVDYTPVRQVELWRQYFPAFGGPQNYEGLALGPVLDDGGRSVILVADNDRFPSTLLALRLDAAGRLAPPSAGDEASGE